MSATIGALRAELSANTAKFERDMGKARKSVKGFSASTKESFRSIGQASAAVLAGVVALGAGIVALGVKGAGIGDVSREFGILSDKLGESADVMLGALRRGTVGTISDFGLMKAANKAMGAGLRVSASDIEALATGARLLAKRVGVDTEQAFEQLTNAMATGRTQGIKSLGLFVDLAAATDDYQLQTGKLESELTDADRAAALQTATMRALRGVIGDAGPQAADFGEKIAGVKTQLTNMVDAIAVAISESPVLGAALDRVGSIFEEALGPNKERIITSTLDLVGRFAIVLAGVAEVGVKAGKFLGRAWSSLQMVFAATMSILTSVALAFAEITAAGAELASRIPGIGNKFKGLGSAARDTATFLGGMQQSFHDQAEEAWEGVKGNSAYEDGLDSLDDTLDTVQQAMREATGAEADLAMATATVTQRQNDATDAWLRGQEGIARLTSGTTGATAGLRTFGSGLAETTLTLDGVSWAAIELRDQLADRGLTGEVAVLEDAFLSLTPEERENELVMRRVAEAAAALIARGAQLSGTLTLLAQSAGIATLSMDQMYGGLQLIVPTMDDVGGEATGFFGRLVSGFQGLFGQTESGTKNWAGTLVDKFKGVFTQTESGTTNWVGSMAGLFGGLFGGPGGVGGSIASIIEGGMAMALNALVPGLGALAGVAMQGLKKIGGMFKSAFGKIGGWIKGMFGGPGKKEMGGRRASDDFKAMTNEMISDAGRAKVEMMVQNEGWHRDLAIQVVAVGEKYKELGLTQQEANRDVKATWDAIKRGPNAVNRAVQLIIDKMNGVTKVAQDATAAIDLTFAERTIGIGFDIDTQAIRDALARIPTIIAGLPSGTIPALAQGGIVTRPTLALVGEAGPEAVVPLSGGGGGLGGMSMDAVVERLDRLDRTLYQQPRVMARALAAALQMGVA